MTLQRSLPLGILGLIASPFFADAQDVAPRAPERPPALQAPADATAVIRALLAGHAIGESAGLAENSYDFNAPGGVPGFGAMESADRRLAGILRE
jgi:hypothetical protein